MKKKYLSKSQISEIVDTCAVAYRKKRIERIPTRPSVSPIVGQTIHKAQEYYLGYKLEHVLAPKMGDVFIFAQKIFDEYFMQEDLNYGNLFKRFFLKESHESKIQIRKIKNDEMYAGINALLPYWERMNSRYIELGSDFDIPYSDSVISVRVYADWIGDFFIDELKYVEEEFIGTGKTGKPLKPKIIRVGYPTGQKINVQSIDLKVSGKKKTQKEVDTDIALPIAIIAEMLHENRMGEYIERLNNHNPAYAGYLNLVINTSPKTRRLTTSVNVIYTKIDAQKLQVMEERIKVVQNSVDCGVFVPCPATHWKCTPEFCDYFEFCEYTINSDNENEEEEIENE